MPSPLKELVVIILELCPFSWFFLVMSLIASPSSVFSVSEGAAFPLLSFFIFIFFFLISLPSSTLFGVGRVFCPEAASSSILVVSLDNEIEVGLSSEEHTRAFGLADCGVTGGARVASHLEWQGLPEAKAGGETRKLQLGFSQTGPLKGLTHGVHNQRLQWWVSHSFNLQFTQVFCSLFLIKFRLGLCCFSFSFECRWVCNKGKSGYMPTDGD